MASSAQSAVGSLMAGAKSSIDDILADQGMAPGSRAAALFQTMALYGVFCVTRKLVATSRSFSQYCTQASPRISPKTLASRYGGEPRASVMILNTVDQIGNVYCHELAAMGFDLILSGPPIDSERMERQAAVIQERHQVRAKVIIIDYNKLVTRKDDIETDSATNQEIIEALDGLEICMLINNQTYTVPLDYARADLMQDQIQAILAQINKHISCSLLIQQRVVPKMLERKAAQPKVRSAIVTVRSHANALYEQRLGSTFYCPVLRSAMAFNSALTEAMREHYSADIDIMQALTPVVAFESYVSQGLILEVLMQERLMAGHVRSVLNHLARGFAETHGSLEDAMCSTLQRFIPSAHEWQSRLFARYAQMADEQRLRVTQGIEQLKDGTDGLDSDGLVATQSSQQKSTPDSKRGNLDPPEMVETNDMCIQAFESHRQNFSEPSVVISEDVKDDESEWMDLDEMELTYEEIEFECEPKEGDKLELYNERRVYQAEMSSNLKAVAQLTKQNTQHLMEQKIRQDQKAGELIMNAEKTLAMLNEPNTAEGMNLLSPADKSDSDTHTCERIPTEEQVEMPPSPQNASSPKEQRRVAYSSTYRQNNPSRNTMQTPGSNQSTAAESLNTLNARPATPKKPVPSVEKQKEIIVEEMKPVEDSKDANAEAPTRHQTPATNESATPPATNESITPRGQKEVIKPIQQQPKQPEEKKEEPPKPAEQPKPVEQPKPIEQVKPVEPVKPVEKARVESTRLPEPAEDHTRMLSARSGRSGRSCSQQASPRPSYAQDNDLVPKKDNQSVLSPQTFKPDTCTSEELANSVATSELEECKSLPDNPLEESKGPVPQAELTMHEAQQQKREEAVSEAASSLQVLKQDKSEGKSEAVSVDTNDTFTKGDKSDSKEARASRFGPRVDNDDIPQKPKPYNQKSKQREESMSKYLAQTDAEPDQQNTSTKETEMPAETPVKIAEEKPQNPQDKVTPRSDEEKQSAKSAKSKDSQLFKAKLSPITEEKKKPEMQFDQRDGAQTPAFRESSIERQRSQSNDKEQENEIVNKDRKDSDDLEITPRNLQEEIKNVMKPMIKVPTRDVSPVSRNFQQAASMLNKSRNKSQSNSDLDLSMEWKQTAFKTISGATPAPNKSPLKPTFDQTLQPRNKTASPDLTTSSEQAIRIQEATIEMDEEEKELFGLTNSDEKHPPEMIQTQKLPKSILGLSKKMPSEEGKEENSLSGRDQNDSRVKTARMDASVSPRPEGDNNALEDSSNSQMRELEMALGGGISDISDHQFGFISGSGQGGDVIFSDEGSEDSFARDEDFEAEEEEQIWQQTENVQKPSIQFLRQITKKIETQGDELDFAIKKVLSNLVANVLTEYDPNASQLDPNLTKAQKLERRNQQLIYELATCLPFVKVSAGRYFLGTEMRAIQVKGRGVLVRTGGGFMYLYEFLLHYAKSECLRIGLNMLKSKKSYQQVTVALLKKHRDTQQAIKDFIKKCPKDIDTQFNALVSEVRDVEQKLAKQRQKVTNNPTKTLNQSNSMNESFVSNNSAAKQKMPTLYIKKDKSTPAKLLLTLNQEKLAQANLSPDRRNSNRSGGLGSYRSGGLGSHRSGQLSHRSAKGKLNSNRSQGHLFTINPNASAPVHKTEPQEESPKKMISPLTKFQGKQGSLNQSLLLSKTSSSQQQLHNSLLTPVRTSTPEEFSGISGSPSPEKKRKMTSPSKKKKSTAKKQRTANDDK